MTGGPLADTPGPAVVTGAAGFIGWHLVRHLAARGRVVLATDLHPAPGPLPPGVEWRRADLRDRAAIAALVEEAAVVLHLASAHLDVRASAEEFEAVNVRAVEVLVDECAERGVRRLVHTSSVGIYGHVDDPPADEEAPKRPGNRYEVSKLAGEAVALRRAAALGLDLVVLRPTWVYGPGCPRTAKLLRALTARRFFYVGDGSNLRHPLWIGDMLEAFERAEAAPAAASGQAFIVGGPEVLTLRELVETCARVLDVPAPSVLLPRAAGLALATAAELAFGLAGREPPLSRRTLAFFENDNAFDSGKAARRLGWRARTRFEAGIQRTVDALREGRAAGATSGGSAHNREMEIV